MPQAAIAAAIPAASAAAVSLIQTLLINVGFRFQEAGSEWVCAIRPRGERS